MVSPYARDIVFWNANSLNARKMTELEVLTAVYKPLCIAICECKYGSAAEVVDLPGYISFAKPFKKGESGLVIYVLDCVVVQRRLDIEGDCKHALWLDCKLPERRSLLLGLCYFQQSGGSHGFDDLLASLRRAATSGKPCVAVGDFNCHHSSWNLHKSNSYGKQLFELCSELNWINLNSTFCPGAITRPSLVVNDGNANDCSVIDLAIASDPSLFAGLHPDSEMKLLSDHFPMVLSLSAPFIIPKRTDEYVRWRVETADWPTYFEMLETRFASMLNRFDETIMGVAAQDAVDGLWAAFLDAIWDVALPTVGLKRVSSSRKPWWSSELSAVLQQFHTARRRFLKRRNCPAARQNYLYQRKRWRNAVKAAKEDCWSRQCANLEGADGRVIWSRWNAANSPLERFPVDQIVDDTGEPPSTVPEGLNRLAKHFAKQCSLPAEAKRSEFDRATCEFAEAASPTLVPSPADTPFLLGDVKKQLARVPLTAAGADKLHPMLLRRLPHSGAVYLQRLFNFSWDNAVLPQQWKLANVCPIIKDRHGPRNDATNYRPISLTPIVCKLLERLILRRLWALVTDKISRFQTGFKQRQSTLNNMYRLYSALNEALSRPSTCISAVFLDLKSAFDRVWIPGLLRKLADAGIKGKAWGWLRAFLSGRYMRIVHNGVESDWFEVTAGVPQGAVLSPFLFLIYINDVVDCAVDAGCDIALFADDIVAWPSVELDELGDACLQRFLDILTPWATKWKILFGQKKSQAVRFTNRRNPPARKRFELAGFQLEDAPHYKYLGVFFQANLKWDKQTDETIRKANAVSALICKNIAPGRAPGLACVAHLVETLLLPVISYGFPIWNVEPSRRNELDQIIARPFRRLLSLPQASTHALSTIVECGSLACNSLYALSALRFGAAILKLETKDPCKALYFRHENAMAAAIRRCQRDTGVRCDSKHSMLAVRSSIDSWQHQDWFFADTGSKSLKGLKISPGPSLYLLRDPRQLSAIRARLRFDRSSLNKSLFDRKVVPDPACPTCKMPETTEHCLLFCPRFDVQRQLCQQRLADLQLPFTLATLLGSTDHVNNRLQDSVLSISGSFLLEINKTRKL
jgi:hypothetical protein